MKADLRILHMRDAINRIQKETHGVGYLELSGNDTLMRAIMYDIIIIGEASKNVPENFKTDYANIPWKNIAGTRDKLTHDYFDVDTDIIWNIITLELPKLKNAVEGYIAEHPEIDSFK